MKIREHPRIIHWPPTWVEPLGNDCLTLDKSEDLLLKEVKPLHQHANDYHSYILIMAEDRSKTGNLLGGVKTAKTFTSILIFMKDSEFLDHLHQKLKSSVGKTIREIGDSEI
jgi:hypothetical protein